MTSQKPTLTVPGGLLIAFEGIDGSGKTTMARRTAEQLCNEGFHAVYLREPTDGVHGRRLRQIMVSPEQRDPKLEFELFLLDRQEDVQKNIRPVLDAGGIVCIDRYYISSMAYQGALGIDPEHIRIENEKFAPVPDLILRFKVSIDTALDRISSSRADGANQFEKREYLEKVETIFCQMNFPDIRDIAAEKPISQVFSETWEIVNGRIRAQKLK